MTFALHPDTQLGPVKLKVSNLERSIAFYQEIIGFDILRKRDQIVELTADGKETLLILEEVSSGSMYQPGTTLGLYHVAILLPERSDLGLFLKHIIDKRIEIGSADHFVSEAIYLSDPDFNGLEIYRDRPREEWTKVASGDYTMVTERIDVEGLLDSTGEDVWHGLPPQTKIGHIHLHVRDLKESQDFYKSLGFEITVGNMTNVGMLFLAAGGYHHHIGLNIWAGPNALVRSKNAVGLAYYTVMLPNQDELTDLIDHLKATGHKPVEQEIGVWVVLDPIGIEIQLTTESSKNMEEK
ncbi:VOC family protein [Halalkalibacter okhensis]|uniref:Glyoxalase n=1 Tax=Halalkalibacter okhensis TaxID=333138 RepID=A0A0B0IDN2_9BACI|nr:VOC family protein [Halalkalibacter okhensis]KHF38977.1 glyoxalase [Halalkalibacter okhensis]